MTKVVCCPTTSSYFYCFSDAHEKHHFVVEGERSETYQDQVYQFSKDISFHRYSVKDLRRKIQQPGSKVESAVKKNLPQIVANMTKKIQALANGDLLDEEGIVKQKIDTIHPVPYVKDVGGIGFASMCVFTGLATSPEAIQTAKQSRVNNSSTNSPIKAMCDEIGIDFDTSGTISSGIWRPLAASIGEVPASIENGVCGNWRHKPSNDCFFHGQNLYNLSDTSKSVMVKAFGSKTWEPLNCFSFGVSFPSKEGL